MSVPFENEIRKQLKSRICFAVQERAEALKGYCEPAVTFMSRSV
ncbi:hypothetical protein TRICHSKD4_1723 [Roseibium sp. TrichSKD4]|nr:hypothetical protein TRICHSKD4_1723 [Roseibium sp. TrichSKD4]